MRESRKVVSLKLIDAHVHCVPFSAQAEFFRRGLSAIFRKPASEEMEEPIESLLKDMERAGVDASVVVTPGNLDVFERHTETSRAKLFAAVIFDSRNPEKSLKSVRETVAGKRHIVKSLKTLYPYLGHHPAQKEFFPLYEYCEEQNLPIQFHTGGDPAMEQLSNPVYFAKVCSLFPKLKLVCLHAGGGHLQTIPALIDLWENVFVELEGLQLHEAEGSREPGVLNYLLERTDSSRLMFGSDRIFPEDKYFWRVEAVRSLERPHRDNICWRTADKVFGLGLGD